MSQLSVVMTTRDRRPVLAQALQALAASEAWEGVREVLVVNDGSTDDTATYLESLPWVRAVHQAQPAGPAAARNRGIALASAPFVWLLDDDVAVSPQAAGAYLRHLAAHDMSRASAVGPVEQIDEQRTAFEHWLSDGGPQFIWCRIPADRWLDAGEEQYCTSNLVSPTRLLQEHRFDETFRFPRFEDRELSYRLQRQAGHRIHFVAEAHAWHLKRYRFRDWLPAYRLFTEAALHFASLHPDDPQLEAQLSIERARQSDTFSWDTLQRAVATVTRGGARVEVQAGMRALCDHARLHYLRSHLGLGPMTDGNLTSGEALERVRELLGPEL